MSEKICAEWRKKPLYYATIEYHRFWLSVDQPRLKIIEKTQRKMTVELLKDIAQEYRVIRSFKDLDEKDINNVTNAQRITDILNQASDSWVEGSLLDKLASCKKIVNEIRPYTSLGSNGNGAEEPSTVAQENQEKTVNAASAVSKFIWFMQPQGWTVFDKYAATGIGIPATISLDESRSSKPTALDRMETFYSALHYEKFLCLVDEMQNLITFYVPSLQEMTSARILDTLFMARGERGAASRHGIELTRAYLEGLPQEVGRDLKKLACALHEHAPKNQLLGEDGQKLRGKIWLRKQKQRDIEGSH